MKRLRREKPKPQFKNEAELCAAFIRYAEASSDWVAYAETGGFDILFAAPDGAQLGVHAKMTFNAVLMKQAIPSKHWYETEGPDYRAILMPGDRSDWSEVHDICTALGLLFFCNRFGDGADTFDVRMLDREQWPVWSPEKRIKLPAYIPDVAAGASGPIRLTEWKIKALRLCAILEVRGYLERADFRRHDIYVDHRRWTGPNGWLICRDGHYVRGEALNFDKQHPKVYSRILAEMRESLAAEGRAKK